MATALAPQQNRAQWLEERRRGIGGSDAAAVLNMHPRKCALRLFYEKRGELSLEDEETEAMYWGTALEPAIATGYEKRTGRKVRRQPMKASRKHPFMLANIDRQIIGDPRGPGIYEGKNLNGYTKVFNQAAELDPYYAVFHLQAHHYMAVYGYTWASLAGLVGGNRLMWLDIPRDQDAIDMLIDAEREFWRRVELGDPPPVDGSDDCDRLLRYLHPGNTGREVELAGDVAVLAPQALTNRAELKRCEERKKALESPIKAALLAEKATLGRIPGWGTLTWSQDQSSPRFDEKRFREEHPDLHRAFCREVPGNIVLRLKPDKEQKSHE